MKKYNKILISVIIIFFIIGIILFIKKENYSSCPNQYYNNGTLFTGDDITESVGSCWLKDYSRLPGICRCPDGWNNTGQSCWTAFPPRSQSCEGCPEGEENANSLDHRCYPKCKNQYHPDSTGYICYPDNSNWILSPDQRNSCYNRSSDQWSDLIRYIDEKYSTYINTNPEKIFILQTMFQSPESATGQLENLAVLLNTWPSNIAEKAATTFFVKEYFKNKVYAPNVTLLDNITDKECKELREVLETNAKNIYNINDINDLPVNRYPFIAAHDSATGYIGNNTAVRIISDLPSIRTQNINFSNQYDCGARFFDCRVNYFKDFPILPDSWNNFLGPYLPDWIKNKEYDPNKPCFQHTLPLEYVEDDESFWEMIDKTINNNDLVFLYFSHCPGAENQTRMRPYLINLLDERCSDRYKVLETYEDCKVSVSTYKSNNYNILFFFERDDPYLHLVEDNYHRDDGKLVTCI